MGSEYIQLSQQVDEVFRIGNDGRIFWKDREVETDDDLRVALAELCENMTKLLTDHALVPNEPVAVVEVWNQGGSGEFATANGIESLPHGTKLYAQNNS
jgi:hypothetical protein